VIANRCPFRGHTISAIFDVFLATKQTFGTVCNQVLKNRRSRDDELADEKQQLDAPGIAFPVAQYG
jgi:hypothetical protein